MARLRSLRSVIPSPRRHTRLPASGGDAPEVPGDIWLLPEIVEARDAIYRLCTRDLRGMAYCMREIGTRTFAGYRVLEVGMGTGHFTAWLAEVVAPGTGIYAFDWSWPMLEVARANARGLSGVRLFRGNARGPLPFPDGWFDVVFLRLAPLGPKGVPNVQAAHALLKPGGWYFEASWRRERFDTPPTQWATDHGFESAEHHCWRYPRLQSEEERLAARIEGSRIADSAGAAASREGLASPAMSRQDVVGGILVVTDEELLVAREPSACCPLT